MEKELKFPEFNPASSPDRDQRCLHVVNWIVREYAPYVRDRYGFKTEAGALRALPVATDRLQLVELSRAARDGAFHVTQAAQWAWNEEHKAELGAYFAGKRLDYADCPTYGAIDAHGVGYV